MSDNLPKIPEEMKEQMDENTDSDETEEIGGNSHELDTDNLSLLDPKLVQQLQQTDHEDMLVEFDGSKRAGEEDERMNLTREWFTQEDDYRSDTRITGQQVYALTLLRGINGMFPNLDLESQQGFINEFVDNFEHYMLSVDGFARKQEENVLRSVHGDHAELGARDSDSIFMSMLSNPQKKKENSE